MINVFFFFLIHIILKTTLFIPSSDTTKILVLTKTLMVLFFQPVLSLFIWSDLVLWNIKSNIIWLYQLSYGMVLILFHFENVKFDFLVKVIVVNMYLLIVLIHFLMKLRNNGIIKIVWNKIFPPICVEISLSQMIWPIFKSVDIDLGKNKYKDVCYLFYFQE